MREKYIRKIFEIPIVAYMAGIVDGEGALTIGTYSKGPNGNPWYGTYLTISSTDELLIDWLVSNFGAKKMIYTRAQTPKNSLKTVFRWQVTGDRLYHICELILPYSVIKKRQIQIVMEMVKTSKLVYYSAGHSGPQVLPEVHVLRSKLCCELRSLHNRRGSLPLIN